MQFSKPNTEGTRSLIINIPTGESGYMEALSCAGMPLLFTCDKYLYILMQSAAGLQGKMFLPGAEMRSQLIH